MTQEYCEFRPGICKGRSEPGSPTESNFPGVSANLRAYIGKMERGRND